MLQISQERWIVYFSGRDAFNRSRVFAAEVDPQDLTVREVYRDPVLDLGAPGAFDEHGIGAGTVVHVGGRIRLYFSGGRRSLEAPYVAGIGVAESLDGGRSFKRLQDTPILGPSEINPYGASTPTVLRHARGWVMWYSGFEKWRDIDGKLEPIYDIRCAFSSDGLSWQLQAGSTLGFADETEGGLVRPQILSTGEHQLLIVAARGWRDFRAGEAQRYRLVCARSVDGETWTRDPDAIEIDPADSEDDWDRDMRCYPWLVEDGARRLLFFNGNDFGRHGFGVGELRPIGEAA